MTEIYKMMHGAERSFFFLARNSRLSENDWQEISDGQKKVVFTQCTSSL